jgi:hypothetical protein
VIKSENNPDMSEKETFCSWERLKAYPFNSSQDLMNDNGLEVYRSSQIFSIFE